MSKILTSVPCPRCSKPMELIGTEKNHRVLYCSNCDLVQKEEKPIDRIEMAGKPMLRKFPSLRKTKSQDADAD